MLATKPQGVTTYTRRMNLISPAARALGKGVHLDMETIDRMANEGSGMLTDMGHRYHREGLEVLAQSADEADLTYVGRRAAREMLVWSLVRRMMLVEVRKTHPEIFEQPIMPSFLIMGFPRTGTTHLHRLLACDERFRGIPTWETRRPIPFPLLNPDMADNRRERGIHDDGLSQRYTPDKDSVHYSDVDTPEECCVMLTATFNVALFWSRLPVYRFAEWLQQEGFKNVDEVGKDYRAFLQVIQHGDTSTGLALKSPDHTPGLGMLLETVPEAMIIQTHRNPIKSSNSLHSMVYGNHTHVATKLDPKRMARTNLNHLDAAFRYNALGREKHPNRVFDADYQDLVSKPIELVRSIYEWFSVDWPTNHEDVLQAYLDANPQNKFGSHKYSSEDFGLTDDEVLAHFSDYLDAFPMARP